MSSLSHSPFSKVPYGDIAAIANPVAIEMISPMDGVFDIMDGPPVAVWSNNKPKGKEKLFLSSNTDSRQYYSETGLMNRHHEVEKTQ